MHQPVWKSHIKISLWRAETVFTLLNLSLNTPDLYKISDSSLVVVFSLVNKDKENTVDS